MELVEGGNLAQRIYHPSKRRLSYLEVRIVSLEVGSNYFMVCFAASIHPRVSTTQQDKRRLSSWRCVYCV
jgi:hypothetical protein